MFLSPHTGIILHPFVIVKNYFCFSALCY